MNNHMSDLQLALYIIGSFVLGFLVGAQCG